jgi:succinoglycan biosynthesis protein ExoM
VVDNDAAGQAGETLARLKAELGLAIEYDIEPENTIPAARNRALELARGNYIGIIDDDEFAPQHWLVTLYRTIQRYGVDGGLGPVYPFYRQRPPNWILKGRFGERPVIPTGTLLNWDQTRTGNVLLKRDVFDRHHLRFDLRWKTSGSDRAFFKAAIAAGYRFIAVKDAPVYETVPPVRWKKAYYLRRAVVQGYNTHKNAADEIYGLRRITVPLKLAAASGVYALALPFARGLGMHMYVKVLERGGHHLSRLLAMLGIELIKKRDF